jgi:DNA ligase-1
MHDLFRSGNFSSISNIDPETEDDVAVERKPSTSTLFGQATMPSSSSSKALPVISATTAKATAAGLDFDFDFDPDPFLFRPETVDTSGGPGGRLPYEVLVGVYLQVGGTRCRLAIVRIIFK